jgi:low molecular weight protein-tyrosine phosphatase
MLGLMSADLPVIGQAPAPRNPLGPYRICVVCLGNICRSPTAEVLLRDELEKAGLNGKVVVESAGTGDWHVGEAMHPGARAELDRRGLEGSGHRARQIERSWLAGYDLVLAMDRRNLASLRHLAADDPDLTGRIQLMLSFDPVSDDDAEVPDPYEGSPDEFEAVFDLLEPASRAVASQLAEML